MLAACQDSTTEPQAVAATVAASASALTATSGAPAHDLYASKGITCDACHPCGKRLPGGHAVAWMDQAGTGFHAASANAGLATCQGCHGTALDGVGGTTIIACAQCHGASWSTNCTLCHGGADNTTGAPPRATFGNQADAVRAGTHSAHVSAGHALAAPVSCALCHPVPTDAFTPGHLDGGTAEVTFAGLAAPGAGVPASWDRAQATCSNTYCHGATVGGGTVKTPTWTTTDGSARACDACHGAPPPAPHTTSTSCGVCHAGYTSTSVTAATHIDGQVQVTSNHAAGYATGSVHGKDANLGGLTTCKSCHGADLAGGSTGVSCTACHATAGFATWDTTCTFCHGNPTTGVQSPPVDIQGRAVATNVSVGLHQSHVATTLTAPLTCVQCHPARTTSIITDAAHVDGNGVAEIAFGALATTGGAVPVYTRTSDTAATCGSTYCHGKFTGGANATVSWTDTAQVTCTSCHGAPPPAPHSSSTSCGTCHSGYTASSVNAATHIDGQVQVTSNHAAGYATGSVHGKDANLGGLTTCKSCHGADLTGGSAGVSCTACHTTAGFATWYTNCTFCHGNPTTGVQSPPVDIQGRTVATNVSVGVHAAHVATTIATPLTCVQCHPARATSVITDTAHMDGNGIAEVAFGALAKTGGAAAVYTRTSATAATCGSTYCHGRFTGGVSSGAGATMSWTSTAQVGCTSCHGTPPSTGKHSKSEHRTCNDCHAGYTSTAVRASTHVDGVKQLGGARITSWNASTRRCTPTCHGAETW